LLFNSYYQRKKGSFSKTPTSKEEKQLLDKKTSPLKKYKNIKKQIQKAKKKLLVNFWPQFGTCCGWIPILSLGFLRQFEALKHPIFPSLFKKQKWIYLPTVPTIL